MSTIESMCEMPTGQASTHAPQVVQDQSTSSPTASLTIETDACGEGSFAASAPIISGARLSM